MGEGEPQCSIAAHGDSRNRSAGAAGCDAVLALNVRHEFLDEKVAVRDLAVRGIDIKAALSFRCNDEEIPDLAFFAEIIGQRPAAAFKQTLFVVPKPVQKIENRIAAALARWHVIASGQ